MLASVTVYDGYFLIEHCGSIVHVQEAANALNYAAGTGSNELDDGATLLLRDTEKRVSSRRPKRPPPPLKKYFHSTVNPDGCCMYNGMEGKWIPFRCSRLIKYTTGKS